jgi:hypothetical protein
MKCLLDLESKHLRKVGLEGLAERLEAICNGKQPVEVEVYAPRGCEISGVTSSSSASMDDFDPDLVRFDDRPAPTKD